MRISCECHEKGLLPLDTEIAVRERSGDVCEMCSQEAATELCTLGHLREFARADNVRHLCKSCHSEAHQRLAMMAEKLGPYFREVFEKLQEQ